MTFHVSNKSPPTSCYPRLTCRSRFPLHKLHNPSPPPLRLLLICWHLHMCSFPTMFHNFKLCVIIPLHFTLAEGPSNLPTCPLHSVSFLFYLFETEKNLCSYKALLPHKLPNLHFLHVVFIKCLTIVLRFCKTLSGMYSVKIKFQYITFTYLV